MLGVATGLVALSALAAGRLTPQEKAEA
jgi:hypothetical protein